MSHQELAEEIVRARTRGAATYPCLFEMSISLEKPGRVQKFY